ncbi:uncharacterized protein N7483_001816 [Penicillium malachiteum]|uniref:uncharacterized protein n=1 Tax=Penicillium malachiteum TaxID=1324776 RepID=UPI002546B409|nr:uncharacterized protein N7483_001816 [Penicillium malachiteum]KAJ5736691.1 hypothetical protein N7483_001816 [Penicillium malachiteum]
MSVHCIPKVWGIIGSSLRNEQAQFIHDPENSGVPLTAATTHDVKGPSPLMQASQLFVVRNIPTR